MLITHCLLCIFLLHLFAECPTEPKILEIILGVIGGIVFLGLVALLIWRLIATLHDRRDFAKFEKETKTAQWNSVSVNKFFCTNLV